MVIRGDVTHVLITIIFFEEVFYLELFFARYLILVYFLIFILGVSDSSPLSYGMVYVFEFFRRAS